MPRIQITPEISVEAGTGFRLLRRSQNKQSPSSFSSTRASILLEQGLRQAEFKIAPAFIVEPADKLKRLGKINKTTPPKAHVKVAPNQSAVLLIENEGGVLEWVFPDEAADPPISNVQKSTTSGKALTFTLGSPEPIRASTTKVGRAWRWVGRRLLRPIKVRVLTFVASKSLSYLMRKIDGGGPFGLVDMRSPDPNKWAPADLNSLPAPSNKRVLLLIHGTFSNTLGSYGGLAATSEGRSFLAAVIQSYDLVLGFDHKTLGEDPESNAQDLAEAIGPLPEGVEVDIVCYSRGALVARSLIRDRDDTIGHVNFQKIIFVGSTNGGTQLAEPDNWKRLIDLYINIGSAAGKSLGVVGLPIAGAVVSSLIKVLGRFVQTLATMAIHGQTVPGLSAMKPDSDLIKRLNDGTENSSEYYAVLSNFEPRRRVGRGLSTAFFQFLADGFMDGLMREANDLVVDNENMINFGGASIQSDRLLKFSEDKGVYHTIYFNTPKTAQFVNGCLLS